MKQMNIFKRISGTIILPLIIFIVMYIAFIATGKTSYVSSMWKIVFCDLAVAASCALGIGLQFKNGRFDFSGGAIMLLAAIFAGHMARSMFGSNIFIFGLLCIVFCVLFSVVVALVYVYGRLPIVIATIGMALLYESITCLAYGGAGAKYTSDMSLSKLYTFPIVVIPFVGAIAVYGIYSYITSTGKQASLLANNQQAAVNIGINEKKNVIISYIYSGIIFGFATMMYAVKDMHAASFTSLQTAGELFSNILPVFIGLMLMGFCGDLIGTIMGALTLSLLAYGLSAIFTANMGVAISTVVTGVFILILNVVSGQGSAWIVAIMKVFKKSMKPIE